jgi:N-carbamoyl-L-amino-acid hydrolase
MKLHEILPQAMLFRDLNGGISHNPLKSTASDDTQFTVDVFSHVLNQLAMENA